MRIEPDQSEVLGSLVVKKGFSGAVVAVVAFGIMSFFHGLSPVEKTAGTVVVIGVVESFRNFCKRKFPRVFSFL